MYLEYQVYNKARQL